MSSIFFKHKSDFPKGHVGALLAELGFMIQPPARCDASSRLRARQHLSESGMLTFDYVAYLESVIYGMTIIVPVIKRRSDLLLQIVQKSIGNCNHCMNECSLEQSNVCAEIDYDCVICKKTDCVCRTCEKGSNFELHIVPGANADGPMQKPIELYPESGLPCLNTLKIIPIFIEHRHTNEINGGLYDVQRDMIYFAGTGDDDGGRWLDNEEQGETWRAWLAYPTKRECSAAPWKELPDEGLTEEELHEIT